MKFETTSQKGHQKEFYQKPQEGGNPNHDHRKLPATPLEQRPDALHEGAGDGEEDDGVTDRKMPHALAAGLPRLLCDKFRGGLITDFFLPIGQMTGVPRE